MNSGIDMRVHAAISSGHVHLRQIVQITGYRDRLVDRSLQRLRRKGKIHYTGNADDAGWRITASTGAEMKRMTDERLADITAMNERGTIRKGHIYELLQTLEDMRDEAESVAQEALTAFAEKDQRIKELEAELAEYKTEPCEVKAWKPEVKYSEALEQK